MEGGLGALFVFSKKRCRNHQLITMGKTVEKIGKTRFDTRLGVADNLGCLYYLEISHTSRGKLGGGCIGMDDRLDIRRINSQKKLSSFLT